MAQQKHAFVSTVTITLDYMGNQVTKLKCANCYKNFENSAKAVKALDKYWHVGCLKCVSCKERILGQYTPKGKGAECKACALGIDDLFDNLEGFLGKEEVKKAVPGTKFPKCAKCGKKIVDKGCTSQDGKTYHQKCFCCDECGKSIAGQPYGTDEKNKDYKICQQCMAKYQ